MKIVNVKNNKIQCLILKIILWYIHQKTKIVNVKNKSQKLFRDIPIRKL